MLIRSKSSPRYVNTVKNYMSIMSIHRRLHPYILVHVLPFIGLVLL